MLKLLKDGQPCDHPGCTSHVTHPCEGCRRKGAGGGIVLYTRDRKPAELLGSEMGDAIDILVAERVMGWSIKKHPSGNHPRMWMAEKGKGYLTGWTADEGSVASEASLPFGVFRPSLNWDAAGLVLEKTRLVVWPELDGDGWYSAKLGTKVPGVTATTAPLAICLAALWRSGWRGDRGH